MKKFYYNTKLGEIIKVNTIQHLKHHGSKGIKASILPSGYLDLRNLQLNKNKQPFIAKSNKYLKCDFTNSNFIETNWIECEFDNCKFINIDFSKACLKATEIKNCIFEGCNFTAAIFSFRKCKKFGLFQETEFFNCNLTNIHVDLPLFKTVNSKIVFIKTPIFKEVDLKIVNSLV